jgi:hypothetical protein
MGSLPMDKQIGGGNSGHFTNFCFICGLAYDSGVCISSQDIILSWTQNHPCISRHNACDLGLGLVQYVLSLDFIYIGKPSVGNQDLVTGNILDVIKAIYCLEIKLFIVIIIVHHLIFIVHHLLFIVYYSLFIGIAHHLGIFWEISF